MASTNHPGEVLVVDDENNVCSMLSEILRANGFHVETANSGAAALDVTRQREFDAVLLDLRMPDMDGLEVFRALRERDYPAEVIFLTAYGTIRSAVEALKMGALDYLVKPGAIHNLPEKTQRAVDLKRQKKKGLTGHAVQVLAGEFSLTPKQAEVCESLLEGRTNAEIAEHMNISEHTVKTHLKKVFEKIGVDSRTELAARILRHISQDKSK